MSVNLNEFTSSQLQTLLDVVVAKIVDEDEHKKEWIKRFAGPNLEFSSAWYDAMCRPIRDANYEHLTLWRVQILNAIGKVGVREEIVSN